MTIEEIRKGVPDGANAYTRSFIDGAVQYIKLTVDEAYQYCDYDSMPNRWRKLHHINTGNIHLFKLLINPLHGE